MKKFLLGMSLLFCMGFPATEAALGQDITGIWRAESVGSDGKTNETFFLLKQEKEKITGTVWMVWGELPIHHGTMVGDKFELPLTVEDGGFRYSGHSTDNHLEVAFYTSNKPPARMTARRATIEDMKLAPHEKLPALHHVPSNHLAQTPPMGWNSWNFFAARIDDATVRATADAMVSTGMRDAGYVYLNIDDTWEGARDAAGNLHTNSKFPDMKALADYVHARGLKLGIYSSPGEKTCGGYAGSFGHEEQDAKQFAAWGIDYLKYDWCTASHIYRMEEVRPVYQKMGDALYRTGRPMVYSLCQYGLDDVWAWGPEVGANLWRTTIDISPSFSSVYANAASQEDVAEYAAPGHWNDPDMLEVGNGKLTDEESKAHMSLWALVAAPLIAGNDIAHMSQAVREILMNKDVIAIDQDVLGKQGRRVLHEEGLDVWVRPLADRGEAVGFFNTGSKPLDTVVDWERLGLTPQHVYDVWKHKAVEDSGTSYPVHLEAHSVELLRIK